MSVIVKFLGTAQDGGIPQVGCKCEMCTDIRTGKRKEILQAAVGIENTETGTYYPWKRNFTLWGMDTGKRMESGPFYRGEENT